MSDTDVQQMVDQYHVTADNHQPDAANDMKNAIQDVIENIGFQSQTSENEASDGGSKQN